MSTISDKLTYLNETKQKLKDDLNKFGAELTENDTFRSYSNVLNDIYDKLPRVTGNGSSFTLEDAQNGYLDDFKMYGNTEQTTYTGKNLSYCDIVSGHGITFEGNDINIVNPTDYLYATSKWNIGNNSNLSGKTYTIYTLANGTTGDKNIDLEIGKTGNMYAYQHKLTANTTYKDNLKVQTITLGDEDVFTRIDVYVSGRTTANVNFKVMIVEGSYTEQTIGDYEPYVGGTPSPNPDYPQDVRVVTSNNSVNVIGKNLAYNVSYTSRVNQYYNLVTTSYSVIKDKYYAISVNTPNTGIRCYINLQTSYKLNRLSSNYVETLDGTRKTWIVQATETAIVTDATIISRYDTTSEVETGLLSNLMIEEIPSSSSTSTTYEPYQSQTYPINLGTMELCKIGSYQDYIYKDNGKWYKHSEIGKYTFTGNETIEDYGGDGAKKIANVINGYSTGLNTAPLGYCNISLLKIRYDLYNRSSEGISYNNNEIYMYFANKTYQQLLEMLQNNNLYYILATPTNEEITDTTLIGQLNAIETYTGTNTFSVSNSNDVLPTINVERLKELDKLS